MLCCGAALRLEALVIWWFRNRGAANPVLESFPPPPDFSQLHSNRRRFPQDAYNTLCKSYLCESSRCSHRTGFMNLTDAFESQYSVGSNGQSVLVQGLQTCHSSLGRVMTEIP